MVVMERWHRGCTVAFRAVRASLAPSAPSALRSPLLPKATSCPSWKIRAVRGASLGLFAKKQQIHTKEVNFEIQMQMPSLAPSKLMT